MSVFSEFKKYINENQGKQVRRKDVVNNFVFRNYSLNTIDSNRNYFAKAGYFVNVSHGLYEIIKKVPEDLTFNQLLNEAYDTSEWQKNRKRLERFREKHVYTKTLLTEKTKGC